MLRFTLLYIFFLSTVILFGQTGHINGIVTTTNGLPVEFVNVSIENTSTGAITNKDGYYKINTIQSGTYTLQFTYLGFETETRLVEVKSGHQEINIILKESSKELDEVIIAGTTETQQVRESPIKADVINTKLVQQESATLAELINRAAGVRVRQMGGLGSASNVSINGYQGKAVKYFKDGIPMDYLGNAYDITLVPVSMLDRVEIYKGVLPAKLGADALGGALNMVTKKSVRQNLDFSYEMASFNTHRLSLNTFYRNVSKNTFIGADAFYNHSDNSYHVNVKATDSFTRTRKEVEVKQFNAGFNNYYAEIYGGFAETPWADELRISLTYFRIDKQEQHGALMTDAYGQVTSNQYSFFPTLRYRKTLLNDKLEIDQFLVYNKIHSQRIDTCHCTYDWFGNRIPSESRLGESETDGAFPSIASTNFTSRSYLSYKLNKDHKLELNSVYSDFFRIGSDPFGARYNASGRDILSAPSGYTKWVNSLGIESTFLNNRFNNILVVKDYIYKTNGTDAAYTSFTEDQVVSHGHRFGVAEAIKYALTGNSFFRFSAELATRLPEQNEVFGDGIFVLSNFDIKPERSTNVNLGFRTQKQDRYTIEANSFYRMTKDLILQVPIFIPFSQYQNVQQVKGFGGEIDATFTISKWLTTNGNLTYQELRLFDIKEAANKYLEGARLRNTPYFFGNLGLRTNLKNILHLNTRLQTYAYYTFVHEYYLEDVPKNKEPQNLWSKAQINSDLIIPSQNLITAGFNYSIMKEKITLGFEVKNISNANLYDNFRVQKAGRSFHLKLRYVLN